MLKRRRRKPEQIVKLLQEGEALLSAGKTLGEVLLKLEVTTFAPQKSTRISSTMRTGPQS